MSALETRYRRLVALYPAAHRARYQEEIISTLMDGAGEGQRMPRWRETFDLVWSAASLRIAGGGEARAADPRWRAAAGMFAPFAAVLVGALHLIVPLGRLGWEQRVGAAAIESARLSREPVLLAAAWLVVGVLAFAAWRWTRMVAAALAGTAAAAYVLWHTASAPGQQGGRFAFAWPAVVAALTIGLCLLGARKRLGAWHFAGFTAVAAVFAGSLWIDVMLADVVVKPFDAQGRPRGYSVDMWGGNYPWSPGTDTIGAFPLLVLLALVAVTAWTLMRAEPAIRRRLLALAAVPIVTHFAVSWMYAATWRELTAEQWLGLLLIPAGTLGAGVLLVRRNDNRERLIDLGRASST